MSIRYVVPRRVTLLAREIAWQVENGPTFLEVLSDPVIPTHICFVQKLIISLFEPPIHFQSAIQMDGFRSLAQGEALQFVAKESEKGQEAVLVIGRTTDQGLQGSAFRPKKPVRKPRRCYNCNANSHIASECTLGPQPKRCHNCQSEDHLISQCSQKPPPRKTQN